MKFNCVNENGATWQGEIKRYKEHGSHYHLEISAKGSGISLYFGRASMGQWFVCIPDRNASVIIGDLRNILYNAEKIGVAMDNEIDGHSVAKAIYVFAESKDIQEQDSTQELLDILKNAGFESVE
ncbi:hypothetical protein P4K96_27585 [Bacillus cereus]|uniref:hypothetical protein n=1 Tax=Paenibacillus melissococcoides TaxID=2912268 RepID=UPI0021C3F705|nr:hypothetical protein [Paenibacillus melissococcoides]MEB9897182.1 hypothetical protein [Bacillus cereus]CAH8721281.1 hypothetical protein HTL2_006280 [Paenibacillus melissococcoides]